MLFEPIPAEPERTRVREAMPPWVHRPRGVLLGAAPVEALLARTEQAAIAISNFGACPDGFVATLTVLTARDDDEGPGSPFGWGGWRRRRGESAEDLLRFGVRYPDGGEAELGAQRPQRSEPPDGPVIHPEGGSGGAGEWTQQIWCWPLPPAGTIAFALEWRQEGIALTLHELDAEPIREAAGRSQRVFGEDRAPAGASVTTHATDASAPEPS